MFVKPNAQSSHIEYPLYPDLPRLVITSDCQSAYQRRTYDSSPLRSGVTSPIPRLSSTSDCCLAYLSPGGMYQVIGKVPCALKRINNRQGEWS